MTGHDTDAADRLRSHEPPGYRCPFCFLLAGGTDEHNHPDDVVAVTGLALARIAPVWWPDNPGGALVIPRAHHENLYDLPADAGHAVWDLTQRVARAMRTAYPCQGVSTRQHNEPAGGQDVWHLHVHVLPRHEGDELYPRHHEARWVGLEERRGYAARLRSALGLPAWLDPAGPGQRS